MQQFKTGFMTFMLVLVTASISFAGDFDWMKDFNIQAQADPSGFKARLETRFRLGDLNINTVIGTADTPADAYMLLRLGEMSKQPIDTVVRTYNTKKNKGWGVMAKSLGIKPGSKEFHALKNSQDLYSDSETGKGKGKKKDKSNKGKGKGK